MMIRFFIFFAVVFFISPALLAQYPVSDIPKELLSRAGATVRDENKVIEIKGLNEVIERGNRVITIHNKASEEHAEILFFYNKSIQIKDVKGEVFDAQGNKVGKFGLKDFKDYSAGQSYSLFVDYRVKVFAPTIQQYPVTLSYSYEIRSNQSLVLPAWRPNYDRNVSIEKSSYKIISFPEEELRINSKNYIGEPKIALEGKMKSYQWQIENVMAEREEWFTPGRHVLSTQVMVVPKRFSYYKKNGSFEDWKSFGLWNNENLLANKRELPATTVSHIKELTKNLNTDKDKAKAIYKFMQEKTRYVSIQIGIGGFEPFPAEEVDRLGYGDCKALVNYTQALLDVVNVPSYYCIVESGNTKIDVDPVFANMSDGDHIILCLPFENDTTWLECTNQEIPFGYLGDFTDDRLVLACTPEGGKVMRTKTYTFRDNLQHRIGKFKLDGQGKIIGEMQTKFYGTQFENHLQNFKQNRDEQIKLLHNFYNINRISFGNIKYDIQEQDSLYLVEDLNIEIPNYGVVNGNVLSIRPNIFNKAEIIPDMKNRKNLVKIFRGYTDIDEMEIELPSNVLPVLIPTKIAKTVPMGSYEMDIQLKRGKVICYRRITLKEGEYPIESYAEFVEFMREANLNDGISYNFSISEKR